MHSPRLGDQSTACLIHTHTHKYLQMCSLSTVCVFQTLQVHVHFEAFEWLHYKPAQEGSIIIDILLSPRT